MGKGRIPKIGEYVKGGEKRNGGLRQVAQGTTKFLEGVELLRQYLTEPDETLAEEKLGELRLYRLGIHALAVEKKLRS